MSVLTHLINYLIEAAVFSRQEYPTVECPHGPQHADVVRGEVEQGGRLKMHLAMGVREKSWK